jgi:hypothetical protein
MWAHVLLRIVIGASLVIHGVAHVEITRVWGARESATSWLIGKADGLGNVMSMVALAGFVLAGLALLAGFGVWRPLAVAAACVSLVTIVLFWDRKMALGVAVDVAIVIAVVWAKWPGHDLVGS